MNNIQIRRRILEMLYEVHDRDPEGGIELSELAQCLRLPLDRVRSNLVYLCDPDKKLAQLKKTSVETSVGSGRIYHFVRITATGIDLLDDPNEFNSRFPPQVIYQYVAGDNLEVTIGDNASEVTVGKDIVKLQFGASHSLGELCTRFVASLENDSHYSELDKREIAAWLERLQALLQSNQVDLGEIQRIKQFLTEREGRPAVVTTALFSHPAIVERVQQAVEQLIGRS